MIKGLTALRYSKALFQLDKRKNLNEQRIKEFHELLKIFHEHPKFVSLLQAPQITKEIKQKYIYHHLNEKDPQLIHFLFYLLDQGRLHAIEDIIKEYARLFDEMKNIWNVHLVTTVAIDEHLKNDLIQKLERFYKKTIHLTEEIDPQIMGGALLKIGNQLMDWSIKTRIKKLKEYALTAKS